MMVEKGGIKMRGRSLFPVLAFALAALFLFAGCGMGNEESAKEADFAKLQELEAEIDRLAKIENKTEEEELAYRKAIEKSIQDTVNYYETYGWDEYPFAFEDKESLIKEAEEGIKIHEGFIYQIENDIMPIGADETKEEHIAIERGRIKIIEDFIEKVKAADESDLRALTGEYDYLYELHENRET